jgi:hypothetical protein
LHFACGRVSRVVTASDEADASELIYSLWEKHCIDADMCLKRMEADRDGVRHSEQQQGDVETLSGRPAAMDSSLGLPAAPE